MDTPTTSLEIDGYRFACTERGDGAPLVLVHGSVSDWRTWRTQLDTFGRGRRAIAYSRRYHWPNLPIEPPADYSMDQHVADLAALITRLAPGGAHLVGHSYGAFVCLLLAVRRPGLVRSLSLVEPPLVTLFVRPTRGAGELCRLFARRPRTAAAVLGFGVHARAAARAIRARQPDRAVRIFGTAVLGGETFQRLSDERMAQVHDNLIAAEFLGSGFPPLEAGWLANIRQPVLLISGAESPALFHRIIEHLGTLLPHARHAGIPGASHIVHEDNPGAFDRAVLAFLAEADGATSREKSGRTPQ